MRKLLAASIVVAASVDSELRFFAAWYVCVGVLLLRSVPRTESEATVINAIGEGLP